MAPSDAGVVSVRDPRWLAFLTTRPDATVFHHPAWSTVLEEAYGYRTQVLVETNEAGEIVAGMPLAEVQGAFLDRRLVCLPFSDHCPPIASTPAQLARLTRNLMAWRQTTGVRSVTIHGALSVVPGIQLATRAVRYVLPLGESRDILEDMSGSTRGAIRKAERDGVQARISQSPADLRVFYQLHTQTRRRLGLPVQPRRFIEALWTRVVVAGLGFVVVASKAGQPIAAALFLAWNRNLIYKFGASDERYWELRPNNLAIWTAIEWGCQHGYRVMDFGRTELSNRGLRDFKRRWGSTEEPLVYAYAGPASRGEIPRAPLWAMGKVIRSSPPIVCRAVGELVYGRILGSVA
jgi:CelD/BcsL family acetyltransferase involved in cellulose biosynthesis